MNDDGGELRCELPQTLREKEEHRQYDLGERTARFGENVVEFAGSVKLTPITSPLINQLVRAATSIGANYCEASEAGSDKEFWYRISISNREARETTYWLRMLARAISPRRDRIRELWKEAHELNLIFAAIFRKGKHRPHAP
ncbi:MAG: four helix bundle protein [Thermoguttaceae bacterium]